MLQGIQAKERHARDIFVRGKHTDHTAFVVGMVIFVELIMMLGPRWLSADYFLSLLLLKIGHICF